MGNNTPKGKQNNQDGKNGQNQQLIDIKEKDLKQNANLGKSRWFYNLHFLKWEQYNTLSEEEKKTVFWTIFPLEISNEIERAYINKFPYEKLDKMIFFDFLEQKHVLLCNKDNSLNHVGIVKRDTPNNKIIIKKENHFNVNNNYLHLLDNTIHPYQYNLLNNLAMICYDNIFSSFNCEMSEDKLIIKFLSTTILCTQKLYNFLNNEYQEYLKTNFSKFRTNPFSLITLKSMLLFDFKNEPIYLNYFLNDMVEKDFDVIIMNMFLEASSFGKKILEFSSICSKKNVEYTTFYLCLLYILINKRDSKNTFSLWDLNNIEDENENNIKNDNKGKKDEIIENNIKGNIKNENKKEIKTYIYFSIKQIKNFYENNYFFSKNFLLTSKNKFNNIIEYDTESKDKYVEIEIRIPKKNYVTNLHPIFNIDEIDIGKYSLYNEQNIIFQNNSVFKCIYVDKVNNKVILEFIRDATWNPLLYLIKENKKLFGIHEDAFKYLTEEQRRHVLIARVRNKEVKFMYGLKNLRELEIFDDSEPKTDINLLTSNFKDFKKLKCLSIIGNNMGNKECAALSVGLKFLKNLKILNLSFNCLTDSNISKITFNTNNKIEVLNLKSNTATDVCMETFKNELIKLKNLKELNMLDNQFGDQGLNHLLQVFERIYDLRILIISNCNITNKGISTFAEFFKKNENYMNELEILNLVSNPINDNCLQNLIYIIKKMPSLIKFSVSQSQISQNGLNIIYNTLIKEVNKKWRFDSSGGWFCLIDKDLNEEKKFLSNVIQNETPVIFNTIRISWLKKNKKKLENKIHFDFSNCNLKNKNLIFELEKQFVNFPNLKIINLSFNDNISLIGYEALSKGFKKLYNLTQLILSSNNISDKALEYICDIFEKCKNISIIDLSINNITNIGFINFILNLSKNRIKLLDMDFYSNKIGDDGFRVFCEEAKNETFTDIKKINFSKNELGNEAMKCFSETFLKYNNLTEVDFSYNNFTDDIVLYFNQQINDLVDNIQKIDITNNKLSEGMKNYFKESGIPLNIIY